MYETEQKTKQKRIVLSTEKPSKALESMKSNKASDTRRCSHQTIKVPVLATTIKWPQNLFNSIINELTFLWLGESVPSPDSKKQSDEA